MATAAKKPRAILSVDDAPEDDFINILLHGDPGVGKTPLIATSPRCLILEADPRGTVSAVGSGAEKWKVREHRDLLDAHEYLRHGGTENHDWVWLDSLSIFQDLSLRGIMEDLHAAKSHRQVWAPDRGEYGQNMTRIKQWVQDMVDLPINFGIVCHTFRYEDPDNGNVTLMPWIQGKNMIETVCGYMNIVAWMYVKQKAGKVTERGIRTRKVGKIYARDRYNAIPNGRMINPTMPKIIKAVEAAQAERSETASSEKSVRRGRQSSPRKASVRKTTKKSTSKRTRKAVT